MCPFVLGLGSELAAFSFLTMALEFSISLCSIRNQGLGATWGGRFPECEVYLRHSGHQNGVAEREPEIK